MELKFSFFEKQRQTLRFLRDDVTNEVLYGGGARGGKSWLGCSWVIMECLTKHESSWLIAREELTKLRDTTFLTFFKTCNYLGLKKDVHYFVNASTFTVRFANGSMIFFRELKFIPSDPEFDRIGSYDLTGAFIDESQQINVKAINVLRGRFSVLSGPGWSTIPKMLFTCNPAKNWIYTLFVKPEKDGSIESFRQFVKSLATDNPFVDKAYIENLKKSDKVTVERLLHGNFEYDDDPFTLCQFDKIIEVFKNDHVISDGLKYLTADIARHGSDKAVVGVWDGWNLVEIYEYKKSDTTEIQSLINHLREVHQIPKSRCIADEDGVGGGVVDNCDINGFINNSTPFLENGEKTNYRNLQVQCIYKLAERINNNQINISAEISELQKEHIIQELEWMKSDNKGEQKLGLVSKEVIKGSIGRSPDYRDMMFMRVWFDLKPKAPNFSMTSRNSDQVIKRRK